MTEDLPDSYTYPTDPIKRGREGVIEGRQYESVAITHLLWNVEEGDVLDVETWGTTTDDPTVTITEWSVDEPIGVSESGEKYRLWPRTVTPREPTGKPWLRTEPGDESAGEIQRVWVVERGDG